jgi:hypothetical protein
VLFTQHVAEIVRLWLWASHFVVARRNSSDNVMGATEGGTQSRFVWCFSGSGKTGRIWGLKGAFEWVQAPG